MLASRRVAVLSLVIIGLGWSTLPSTADEELKDIACRSVHLGYPAGEGVAFYNEVTVDESAPGTFFMVCGWNKGYFGMQEQGNGKKVLIFSVWDSGQNNPKAVEEDKRVKLLHKDEKVRIGRFGGEGTGGQSFLDYDWKAGQNYRFLVTARPNATRTEYAGYFYLPEENAWKHLVTFSTITGGKNLGGYYSFVEDFKRDKQSTTKVRKAHFGNAWIQGKDGEWTALRKARFTADRNPAINIDAGVQGDHFFLATGGETRNAGTRLDDIMELPPGKKATPPEGLPAQRAANSG
jgi:hypothetical protein